MVRLPTTHALIPALLASVVIADTTESGSSASQKTTSHVKSSSTSKEDSPFPTLEMYTEGTAAVWYVDVEIGDQKQALRVDIAQPYLWVLNASAFPTCEEIYGTVTTDSHGSSTTISPTTTSSWANSCESNGGYNISSSPEGGVYDNSYGQYLFLNYVYVNGSIAHDSVTFTNDTSSTNGTSLYIDGMDFILGNESSVQVGALGLSGNVDADMTNYNYLILDALVDQGYINSSSYSMGSKTNESGSLVFGAVDRDMYVEPLVQFSNIPYEYRQDDYRNNYPIVPLSAVTVMNDKGAKVLVSDADSVVPALLDSRTSYVYLPMSVVVDIAVQLNAYYSEDNGFWLLKCSVAELDAVVSFYFGNLTIDISIDRFVSALSTTNSTAVEFEDGSQACVLMVLPNTYFGYSVLGMPMLSDTYIAVDNEGFNIAMAQANNENYQSKLKKVDNTTTSSYDLPFASSAIYSDYIPFAQSNNLTDSYTFSYSYAPVSDSAAYMGMTAAYSSGVVFTGRIINSTTSDNVESTSSTSSSSGGGANGSGSVIMGIYGTLACLLIGLIL